MRQTDHQVITHLHNFHDARRAFLIGTGPSLLKPGLPLLSSLASEITFSCNTIMRVPDFPFMPTYYCASEIDALPMLHKEMLEWEERIHTSPNLKFFSSLYLPSLDGAPAPGWTWLYRDYTRDMQNGHFEGLGDSLDSVPYGYSVLLDCALPLACWMGCNPIYLIGFDASKFGHSHQESEDTRGGVRNRQDTVHRSAMTAYRSCVAAGVRLIDLSEGGELPFPSEGKSTLMDVMK